jgi:hypothetical protein
MFGDTLVGAFRAFKRIWDPDGLMNPGKLSSSHLLAARRRQLIRSRDL